MNKRLYLRFWLAVIMASMIISLLGCKKAPMFDPDCGVIASKVQTGEVWQTVYRWNDGTVDTINWHFDPVSMPGDTVCKLKEVDLSEYECDVNN